MKRFFKPIEEGSAKKPALCSSEEDGPNDQRDENKKEKEPLKFVTWNANSLLLRAKNDWPELSKFVSTLDPDEAIVTSVLSRRWKYLWTFAPRIQMSAEEGLISGKHKIQPFLKQQIPNNSLCVKWVNRVIRLHRAPTLEEFRIHLLLTNESKKSIDFWCDFAFTKQVQKFELDFSNESGCNGYYSSHNFPDSVLRLGPFVSLKCLRFSCVDVSQEALDFFLSKCPHLDSLRLHHLKGVRYIRLIGVDLKLRYLDVAYCVDLCRIEIADANIISVRYLGDYDTLSLKNVPHLVELFISVQGDNDADDYYDLHDKLASFSCCLPHLEHLLLFDAFQPRHEVYPFTLSKLKPLELEVAPYDTETFLFYTCLMRAASCLEKVVIKAMRVPSCMVEREIKKLDKCPHQFLKAVEYIGFLGDAIDIEIVLYFIENAEVLETITISPTFKSVLPPDKYYKGVRCHAKLQLEGKVPPSVKLIIL